MYIKVQETNVDPYKAACMCMKCIVHCVWINVNISLEFSNFYFKN